MEFQGFVDADFDVFAVPGLEERMEALKTHLRPKLQQLGTDFSAFLTDMLQRPVFAHVAKHARRTVNPPNDSWVAFCLDKRGYKKHPHFQIGAWGTHVFATFGLIYESPERSHFAEQLRMNANEVLRLVPKHYVWIPDHMDPQAVSARDVGHGELMGLTERLEKRQGELMVGLKIPRAEAVTMSAEAFAATVRRCFETLNPLFQLSTSEVVIR